jgi:hypothetical protein
MLPIQSLEFWEENETNIYERNKRTINIIYFFYSILSLLISFESSNNYTLLQIISSLFWLTIAQRYKYTWIRWGDEKLPFDRRSEKQLIYIDNKDELGENKINGTVLFCMKISSKKVQCLTKRGMFVRDLENVPEISLIVVNNT